MDLFNKGFSLTYQETFALVAKTNSTTVLLSFVANFDWSIHQLDVQNVFHNGDLEKKCL